jgi:hypothetical protein
MNKKATFPGWCNPLGNKLQEHKEGNICCEGCYRLGIDKGKEDERKRVLEIIKNKWDNNKQDMSSYGGMDILVLDEADFEELKQQIQQGDKA